MESVILIWVILIVVLHLYLIGTCILLYIMAADDNLRSNTYRAASEGVSWGGIGYGAAMAIYTIVIWATGQLK